MKIVRQIERHISKSGKTLTNIDRVNIEYRGLERSLMLKSEDTPINPPTPWDGGKVKIKRVDVMDGSFDEKINNVVKDFTSKINKGRIQ